MKLIVSMPSLYNSKHDIVPVLKLKKKINVKVEFVGPICEITDTFVKYKNFNTEPNISSNYEHSGYHLWYN